MIDEFLMAYAGHRNWQEKEPDAIMYRICTKEGYGDNARSREFLMIGMGWILAKSNDFNYAVTNMGVLKYKLDDLKRYLNLEDHWDG